MYKDMFTNLNTNLIFMVTKVYNFKFHVYKAISYKIKIKRNV